MHIMAPCFNPPVSVDECYSCAVIALKGSKEKNRPTTTAMVSVALLHSDGADVSEVLQRLCDLQMKCDLFPVTLGPQLYRTIRQIQAGQPTYSCVLNLCCGREAEGGVSAATAASLLDACKLPYSGCRSAIWSYSLDVFFMMMVYADVPMPRFKVISSVAEATEAARCLQAPIRLRSATPLLSIDSTLVTDAHRIQDALSAALVEYGKVVAWECPSTSAGEEAHLLVSGGSTKGTAAMSNCMTDNWAALHAIGKGFARNVLFGCGLASLCFGSVKRDGKTQWLLTDFTLNPTPSHVLATYSDPTALVAILADAQLDAQAKFPQQNFEVKLHEDSRKGYHLCATRRISKGMVVFADETRSFSIVTRPFVEKNWDKDLRQMFTEYAWPIDADGHVYAIWENDPTRWRPINHSCDPNCIFDAPHSLNVIAARDIAAGEDLSMDYATFCDGTMKPFNCLCGAACCRHRIIPNGQDLSMYGENAWLRKAPSTRKPLL